ncbi:MAG: hypothetical protein NVSMB53_05800 [Gemmatimonadaceae bacterium]
MSAKQTFYQHYQNAAGRTEAPPGLVKAACLYGLDPKLAGLSLDDIVTRLERSFGAPEE